MPDAKYVDPQITDAVTQVNVKVVAEAPAIAMGTLYQTLAHSTGLMFTNAVNAQNSQNVLQQAATTQGVIQIFSVDTMADADASVGLAQSLVQMLQTNQPGGR